MKTYSLLGSIFSYSNQPNIFKYHLTIKIWKQESNFGNQTIMELCKSWAEAHEVAVEGTIWLWRLTGDV